MKMVLDIRPIKKSEYSLMRELAIAAWKSKYRKEEFFDIFREDYLEFVLDGPLKVFNLMLGAFHGNVLLGVAGITVSDFIVKNRIHRLGHLSWLTSFRNNTSGISMQNRSDLAWEKPLHDPNFKTSQKNLPVSYSLCAGIHYHCKKNNIDGFFTYCESGDRSYHAVRNVSKTSNYVKYVQDIKITHPMIRIINLEEILAKKRISGLKGLFAKALGVGRLPKPKQYLGNIKIYAPADLPACLNYLETSAEKNSTFTKIFDLETLGWQFGKPELSKTLLFTVSGNVRGIINYLKMDSISEDGVFTYALVDMLHIHTLDRTQQIGFLLHFLNILKETGYTGALLWHQNRVEEKILPIIGFRSIRRKNSISFHSLLEDLDFRIMRRADVTFR